MNPEPSSSSPLDPALRELRKRAASLRRELERVENAIRVLGGVTAMPPSGRAIDAVVEYLQERGRPEALETLVATMVERGVNRGKQRPAAEIKKSINRWCMPLALKKKKWPSLEHEAPKLKQFKQGIGLYEWEEEGFPNEE